MSQVWEDEENKNALSKVTKTKKNDIIQTLSIQEIPLVLIKQSTLQIGRYCKCGCGYEIPDNARKDRVFFNATCRRVYLNDIKGYTDSKNVIRARMRISKPRRLTVYPEKGSVIKIKITKQDKDLWALCDKIERERK